MKTLAEHLAEHERTSAGCCLCGAVPSDRVCSSSTFVDHSEHVAQTWREARTVRTVEELLALPHGTYIHAAGGVFPNDEVPKAEWEAVLEDCAPLIPLPARVLWIAEEEQ